MPNKSESEKKIISKIISNIESIKNEKIEEINNKINEIKSKDNFKGNIKLEMVVMYLEAFLNVINKKPYIHPYISKKDNN